MSSKREFIKQLDLEIQRLEFLKSVKELHKESLLDRAEKEMNPAQLNRLLGCEPKTKMYLVKS